LKRGRRGFFEKILAENLRRSTGMRVRRLQGRIVIDLTPEADLGRILERIGKVFGVVWYAPAIRSASLEELESRIIQILKSMSVGSVKIDVRRSDKRFPITSLDVSRRIGASIRSRLGLRIDLRNPEKVVIVEITEDGIYASFEKLRGPGGLPLGSSGKLLALFSGSSSALACWYMMKRGCAVDLLHLYEDPPEHFLKAGYASPLDRLLEYSLTCRLYLASAKPFQAASKRAPEELRNPLFKLFIIRVAEAVAKEVGYPGIVAGFRPTSVEEFEELCEILRLRRLPIYTPLMAMEEEEVAGMMERLGLRIEEPSWERCSTGSTPGGGALEEYWEDCELDEAVNQALESLVVFKLRLGEEPVEVGRSRS